ncbi:MAG: cold shock domain-containing protein, partial [Prevotellaceae bacterium]|nr:cold shock domain-containing protein [Prevotellaceae bacterium]
MSTKDLLEIGGDRYSGFITYFNGEYGFITSDKNDYFFHKSVIKQLDYRPVKGDEISFTLQPSRKLKGKFDACSIVFIKKTEKKTDSYLIGVVKWYNLERGYGLIGTTDGKEYFIHKSNLLSDSIKEREMVIFVSNNLKGKLSAVKCRLFSIDVLQGMNENAQTELLKKYLDNLGNIEKSWYFNGNKDWKYNQIKSIAQSDKISEAVKAVFLQSAFEKAGTAYKIQMICDGLFEVTLEFQTELLQKYLDELGRSYSTKDY